MVQGNDRNPDKDLTASLWEQAIADENWELAKRYEATPVKSPTRSVIGEEVFGAVVGGKAIRGTIRTTGLNDVEFGKTLGIPPLETTNPDGFQDITSQPDWPI